MIIISKEDLLQVKYGALIADYDRDSVANLYQPIVGFTALSVYMTLWSEADNQRKCTSISHEQLFERMKIAPGEFVKARKALEAVGLLKTFIKNKKEINCYIYEVYPPKTPKLFFDNTLLYGMLIKSIGVDEANQLMNLYQINNLEEEESSDITSSFAEVFHPNYDDPVFVKALNAGKNIAGHKSNKIKSDFNYDVFKTELNKMSDIKFEDIKKKDLKEIERLSTLFACTEAAAADCFVCSIDSDNKCDYEILRKKFENVNNYQYLTNRKKHKKGDTISGTTDLASKVNIMEDLTPKEYLSLLQGCTKPAGSELKLINDLNKDFSLTNGVINAIVDFVLLTNNNVLSRPYAEKIAASISRENIQTTVDAMSYLKRISSKKQTKTQSPIKVNETKVEEKDNSELDWNQMIDMLEEGIKDGEA